MSNSHYFTRNITSKRPTFKGATSLKLIDEFGIKSIKLKQFQIRELINHVVHCVLTNTKF